MFSSPGACSVEVSKPSNLWMLHTQRPSTCHMRLTSHFSWHIRSASSRGRRGRTQTGLASVCTCTGQEVRCPFPPSAWCYLQHGLVAVDFLLDQSERLSQTCTLPLSQVLQLVLELTTMSSYDFEPSQCLYSEYEGG